MLIAQHRGEGAASQLMAGPHLAYVTPFSLSPRLKTSSRSWNRRNENENLVMDRDRLKMNAASAPPLSLVLQILKL